jgi:uncharacterized protein (UPF0335 family)
MLAKLVQRIESLEAERKSLTEDISEIYKEAKDLGYDTKLLRKAIALRKLSSGERDKIDAYIAEVDAQLGLFDKIESGEVEISVAAA